MSNTSLNICNTGYNSKFQTSCRQDSSSYTDYDKLNEFDCKEELTAVHKNGLLSYVCKTVTVALCVHYQMRVRNTNSIRRRRVSYHCWIEAHSTAHLHHLLCIISSCMSCKNHKAPRQDIVAKTTRRCFNSFEYKQNQPFSSPRIRLKRPLKPNKLRKYLIITANS
jgi:hypothetical protein